MKFNWIKKALSFVLAGAMVICMSAAAGVPATVCAEETEGGGKYVSDVFIAYGKTEEEATKWLKDNGWEPVSGDLNAGKASYWDDRYGHRENVASVMGIKRTDKTYEAVTDMAVMNMKGGYDIPMYEDLVDQKRKDIDEFINTFLPVLKEYRANYNNEGSESGKARADLVYELLNHFYDGGEDEPYAKNDTGGYLGDLFLEPIRQEGNKKGIDLEQVILESTGAAVYAIEVALALAADTSEDTWIERAGGLTGDELAENIVKYVPEAEGQDIAPSALDQFLGQKYGSTAQILSEQWDSVNEKMLWYEDYNTEHGLWPQDGESEEAAAKRVKQYFDDLKKSDEETYNEEYNKYTTCTALYLGLYEIPYEGEWGETMGDFFNPAGDADYLADTNSFLPMAAALSPGQRAAIHLVPLSSMIMLGTHNEDTTAEILPSIEEILGDASEISIYSGMNRGIFRGGVALTSNAMMEQSRGYDPFSDIGSFSGIYNITCYSAMIAALPMIGFGAYLIATSPNPTELLRSIWSAQGGVKIYGDSVNRLVEYMHDVTFGNQKFGPGYAYTSKAEWITEYKKDLQTLRSYEATISEAQAERTSALTGRVLTGVGGALLIGAAVAKGYQVYRYYQKTFTPIPSMIVDEADIVTYSKGEDGKETKNIDFDQFVYYDAVRCNRQEVGKIGDWQDGVEDYVNHGCGDIADINCDIGQEWLALYTVRSERKGDPIFADTLTVQYGSKEMPKKCSKGLHLFTYSNIMDLGDTAYCYNNKKDGVYFFWGEDTGAFEQTTASAFGTGHLALAGIGGLILGIAGASWINLAKRKREEEAA